MTTEEFVNLKPGDTIQSSSGEGYIVTYKMGDYATIAARTITVTNPDEWVLVKNPDEQLAELKQRNTYLEGELRKFVDEVTDKRW